MKLKYPNSLPFICTGIAAIPFLCYYFALMFGELFFGRPSSTWAIGFVWIPFLIFRPALIGLIVGFIIWIVFKRLRVSGEIPKKVLYPLLTLLILASISSVAVGLKKVFEREDYYAPRIAKGKDLLQKEQFLANDKLIEIMSISTNKDKPDNNEKLIIIGERRALLAGLNGEPKAFISFDRRVGETVPVDVEGNGIFEFMNRGGGWQPVSLLDSNGRTLWMYPSEDSLLRGAADTMAAGDFNKDGKLEFVVGMNASGGLHMLDAKGKEIWKRSAGNVFSVEIVDINNDGALEILHSDAGEGIVIRKADGEKIRTIRNCGDGHFSLLYQGNLNKEPLLVCDDNKLKLVDLKDNVVRVFDLPGGGHTPKGCLVYFNGIDKPPHYAFVRTIQATGKRSDLTVFDPNGKLAYHEIFRASYLAMTPLRQRANRFDSLLVGENSRVWLHKMNIHN